MTIQAGNIPNFIGGINGAAGQQNSKNGQGGILGRMFGAKNAQKDPIAEKRALLHKNAFKIVADTFADEQKLDNALDEIRNRNDDLLKTAADEQKQARQYRDEIDALKEQFGVDEDGNGEQAEDYQNAVKDIYERAKQHEEEAQKALDELHANTSALKSAAIERLKSHAMGDAAREKDAAMAAANKEIIGDIAKQAKEHIDEEQKEKEEAAKERAEKKEELEERIEKARKRREEFEERLADAPSHETVEVPDNLDLTNTVADPSLAQEKIQREIEEMLEKMKLLSHDLKGGVVDATA